MPTTCLAILPFLPQATWLRDVDRLKRKDPRQRIFLLSFPRGWLSDALGIPGSTPKGILRQPTRHVQVIPGVQTY
jgi:hypothetical protein